MTTGIGSMGDIPIEERISESKLSHVNYRFTLHSGFLHAINIY